MRVLSIFSLLFCLFTRLFAQDLAYYLPQNIKYNPAIPTPEQFLGYQVGQWHVSHDQLAFYMKELARVSDRISIQEYARTYEDRPLLLLTITSPENHAKIDQIKADHRRNCERGTNYSSEDKLVHWMGYSVHGNEPSGTNAALLMAYYLAAAEDSWLQDVLTETVILFDPAFNPDGLTRFATWVNSNKSITPVSDPSTREMSEPWPGGRTNHYWFDLNRDWMPAQHPESKGRLEIFHEWKPNVLTDHHEMGSNSTFFFQPGVPSRKAQYTPWSNVELTRKIAKYHAAALDSIGSLYFTEEDYDDFYIGKGSTYPDLNGSVGILFEQASSRGHLRETSFGKLAFPFTIRNHVVTSFSTLRAAHNMCSELLQHQRQFYQEAKSLAKADPVKAYVFGSETDQMKAYIMQEILSRHDISIYPLGKSIEKNGQKFNKGAYLVLVDQPQYRLIKSIFDKQLTFDDSLFYDISSWSLPLAFNLDYAELGFGDFQLSDHSQGKIAKPQGRLLGNPTYAYAFEPQGYFAQRAVWRLQRAGILVEISHTVHNSQSKHFSRGSIFIPLGLQPEKKDIIRDLVQEITTEDGIDIYGLETGLSRSGSDLGSRQLEVLVEPKVAILVGSGVDYSEAGEVWHLLDQRLEMPVTLLSVEKIADVNLSRYNKIVVVDGSYGGVSEAGVQKLKNWLSDGGTAIAWKRGGKWLAEKGLIKTEYATIKKDTTGYQTYGDLVLKEGAQEIGGAIFQVKLDQTNPLNYGIDQPQMAVFRDHSLFMKKGGNPYAHPIVYTRTPLLSGYISEEKLKMLPNIPAVTIGKYGRGRVINFADNPNFRAFWFGTNKLFLNALFYGHTINSDAAAE